MWKREGNQIVNAKEITFPSGEADWGKVIGISLFDSATGREIMTKVLEGQQWVDLETEAYTAAKQRLALQEACYAYGDRAQLLLDEIIAADERLKLAEKRVDNAMDDQASARNYLMEIRRLYEKHHRMQDELNV